MSRRPRPATGSLPILFTSLLLAACGTGTGTGHDAALDTGSATPPASAAATAGDNGGDATGGDTSGGDFTGGDAASADPASCDRNDAEQQALALDIINSARATARLCGDDPFPAVEPLALDDRLLQAATQHTRDMSTHNFFSHTGSDGSDVAERVTAQNFIWRAVGENIAAGQDTLDATLQGWLESPGHCRNIMNPAYTRMAIACTSNAQSEYGEYWTQVLAAPY